MPNDIQSRTRPITLAITGDVMLGRRVNETIALRGHSYPWGNLLPIVRRADLLLINLECALTSESHRWTNGAPKAFYFRGDPDTVETLTTGGVDFASLANNHIGDFGMTGLLETIRILERAGIAHAGAGSDISAATTPGRLSSNGWRINVVSYADFPEDWAASSTSPGLNFTRVSPDEVTLGGLRRALSAAREEADLVVMSIHWGPNMRSRPPRSFQEFAREAVSSGADIFWGHSAHVPQGVEIYNGKLILYDTGDFIDDYVVDPGLRNDLSALFLVTVSPPCEMSLRVIPVMIADMRVSVALGDARDWFIHRFTDLCAEFRTEVESRPDEPALLVRSSGTM